MCLNGRKTIGIFLEAMTREFPKRLCQGVIATAKEKGYNVVVFNSFGKYGDNNRHFTGDQMIFDLPPYEELDGVILALDTMEEKSSRDKILGAVRSRCHCPVVSVREVLEGVNNLYVENTTCMEGILRHFIEDHGFTRLCFMSGPETHWDAVERLQCFEHVMEEYGLPVEEHQKFYGDYWKNKGVEACDWFLSGREKPQAIICANDHMALTIVSELIGRGIRVPEDICVSGYDGLVDTVAFTPTVTTMTVPFYKMGGRAVEIIDARQDCPDQVDDVCFQAEVTLRETCGCVRTNGREILRQKRIRYEEDLVAHNRDVQFDYMSIHLGNSNELDEVSKYIAFYSQNIKGLGKYGICLCENLLEREEHTSWTDRMELWVALQDGEILPKCKTSFDRNKLLPDDMLDETPQVWYFAPLHFQDYLYGYECLSFPEPLETGNLYFRWNINIGNKIHDLIVEYKMQKLIQELESMYDRDVLTGLYNRRGWENYGSCVFEQAREERKTIFLAVVDMDGMKMINDNFGHAEGDFALRKMAEAIRSCCRGEDVSARTGGDEFVILAKDITEAEGQVYLQRIEKFLFDFNISGEREYDIHASAGYVCRIPDQEESIQTYTKESDGKMYQNKEMNKKKRGEALR